MDTAIRGELKSMWESMMKEVPVSVKSLLGSSAFEQFVAEQRSSVAARLEMEAKKDAGAVVFVPNSDSTNGNPPPSQGAQNVNSVVGMRGILQKRPVVQGYEVACAPVKVWNCHDLLHESPGTGLQWRLTCILLHAGEARNFTKRGAAAPTGGSSAGSPSPKKHRGEAE